MCCIKQGWVLWWKREDSLYSVWLEPLSEAVSCGQNLNKGSCSCLLLPFIRLHEHIWVCFWVFFKTVFLVVELTNQRNKCFHGSWNHVLLKPFFLLRLLFGVINESSDLAMIKTLILRHFKNLFFFFKTSRGSRFLRVTYIWTAWAAPRLRSQLAFFFSAAPTAYGGSQARVCTGAATASLHHSHSKARSLTPWTRPGIKPASSWILISFLTHWATKGTPQLAFLPLPPQTPT